MLGGNHTSVVVPAKAGTHNPWRFPLKKDFATVPTTRRHGVWVPAFAGTTELRGS
jgi:hypothetical protein